MHCQYHHYCHTVAVHIAQNSFGGGMWGSIAIFYSIQVHLIKRIIGIVSVWSQIGAKHQITYAQWEFVIYITHTQLNDLNIC